MNLEWFVLSWLDNEPALVVRSVSALGGFPEDSANPTPGIDRTKISTRRKTERYVFVSHTYSEKINKVYR